MAHNPESYTLSPNDSPIVVMPEEDRRVVLASEEVNDHLFFISYRDDTVWFSGSHAPCGARGFLFWVKTTRGLSCLR